MAMEHALSLDTRVMSSLDAGDELEPFAPGEAPPSPAKTEAVNPGLSPTAPLAASDDGEYHLAGDDATRVTGVGGSGAPRGRTALRTQAVQKTGAGSDSGQGTHAELRNKESPTNANAPAAKISQFTMVSDEELRGPRESDDTPLKQWGLAGALAIAGLIAISAAIFFATRSPSADQLYAVVKAAADRGGASELTAVENDLTRFLQLYPGDSRAEEVKEYVAELEQYRLERRLKPRILLGAASPAITPVERAYQAALQLANNDPEAALDQLEALLAVYGGAPETEASLTDQRTTSQCLELARQQVARLSPEVERLASEQRAAVQRQLDRAEQIAMADRPAAERIWQGATETPTIDDGARAIRRAGAFRLLLACKSRPGLSVILGQLHRLCASAIAPPNNTRAAQTSAPQTPTQ